MNRRAGVLLHVTSLPGPHETGTLDSQAWEFVDFLARAGLRAWQVLPLQATSASTGHSPYATISAFALDPRLMPPGDLDEAIDDGDVRAFYERQRHWLDDFALFVALRVENQRRSWNEWPAPVRDREPAALDEARSRHASSIERTIRQQCLVRRRWDSLRSRCTELDVETIGDLPYYVRYDSADVWAHRELFKLDDAGNPNFQAGVPPDYFSENGQLWGSPVYDWAASRTTGHAWWIERLGQSLELFDRVRIDHFRGFAACWEVPVHLPTAVDGAWSAGPGNDLFLSAVRRVPLSRLIAEDLGEITDDVRRLQREWKLPGMHVLQFGFGDDFPDSLHLPHRHDRHAIVCTGTHDNNTVRGWFDDDVGQAQRANLTRYVGRPVDSEGVAGELVRMALGSVADTAIVPVQDLLGLGSAARMNRPGQVEGNWGWRLEPGMLGAVDPRAVFAMSSAYGRL